MIWIFNIYFKSVEAEPAVASCNARPRRESAPAPPRSSHRQCPSSVSLGTWRGSCLRPCHPSGKKKGTPATVPPLPAHGDDVGSLLSGFSLLEDFGFSKMNLLRRSVSELAWAPAYASPGDEAEGGLVLWGMPRGLEERWLLSGGRGHSPA